MSRNNTQKVLTRRKLEAHRQMLYRLAMGIKALQFIYTTCDKENRRTDTTFNPRRSPLSYAQARVKYTFTLSLILEHLSTA